MGRRIAGLVGLALATYLVFFDRPVPSELGAIASDHLVIGVVLAFGSVILLITTFDRGPDPSDSLS